MIRWGTTVFAAVIGIFFTVAISFASQPAPPPDEIQGAVEPAFNDFKKAAADNPQKYGFSGKADLERATVEVGYPVYRLTDENLNGFKGNIYQIEEYAQAWDFVVYGEDGKPKTFIEIEYDEQKMQYGLAGFGGEPDNLTRANESLLAFADEEAKNVHFVKVEGQRLLIFEFEYEGKPAPYAIPISTTASDKPLDYKQTIEYIKKLKGLNYDEQLLNQNASSLPKTPGTKTYIWIGLFLLLIIFVIRWSNTRLRKEGEQEPSRVKKKLGR